jgi:hypothetical protein
VTYCYNNVFVYFNLQLTLTGVGETGPQSCKIIYRFEITGNKQKITESLACNYSEIETFSNCFVIVNRMAITSFKVKFNDK